MYSSYFVLVLALATAQFSAVAERLDTLHVVCHESGAITRGGYISELGAPAEDLDAVDSPNENDTQHGKIVGGSITRIEEIPYQVSLMLQTAFGKSQCGGSLISERYVITAAHCVLGASAAYVRIGSSSANTGGSLIYTNSFHVHPQNNPGNSDYDAAIIDLNRYINLDGRTSRAIQLLPEGTFLPEQTEIFVSGWGTTSEGGRVSDTLKGVSVPIVSLATCRRAYGLAMITNRMICAGMPTGGQDSCQGDSGGPATIGRGEYLVGIVSFGNGCARPNTPGVYTNIAAVRDWIRQVTGV